MHEGWKDTDGTIASVDEHATRYGTEYSVVFTYKVDGEWYGGTYTTSESSRKGDPDRPPVRSGQSRAKQSRSA